MNIEEAISVLGESKRQNEIMRDNPNTFFKVSDIVTGEKNAQKRIDALNMAISALRQEEHFREANKALTLDELRQMDGEPAWFVSLHDGFASWGIVRVVEMSKVWFIAVAGAERAFGDLDGYGKTWLAYRQKKEV